MLKLENLKKNLCPGCEGELMWDKEEELLKCECGFAVTSEQFTDYMDDIMDKEYKVNSVDDNLKGLNNL